jgi:hypothetical protein
MRGDTWAAHPACPSSQLKGVPLARPRKRRAVRRSARRREVSRVEEPGHGSWTRWSGNSILLAYTTHVVGLLVHQGKAHS